MTVPASPPLPPAEPLVLDHLGLRLQAQAWGPVTGLPCLAVHGWLDNGNSFWPLVPYLPELRLVAVDLPGHGCSPARSADATYHVVDWVRDVMGVATTLGWSRFVLMGHSMGAAIACLTAGAFPEAVQQLVLLDALGPFSDLPEAMPERLVGHLRQQARRRRRVIRPQVSRASAAALMAQVVPHLSLTSAELLALRGTQPVEGGVAWSHDPRLKDTSVMTLTEAQVEAFLRRIACPTLLVRPLQGLAMPAGQLLRRSSWLADLQQVEVAGGHHAHMESPAQVAAAIRPFLGLS